MFELNENGKRIWEGVSSFRQSDLIKKVRLIKNYKYLFFKLQLSSFDFFFLIIITIFVSKKIFKKYTNLFFLHVTLHPASLNNF